MSSPQDALNHINHIVVLMLENRSFDNVFGFHPDGRFDGLSASAHGNPVDPTQPSGATVAASATAPGAISFDPGHEFDDVHQQLYGVLPGPSSGPLPPSPLTLDGFVASAERAAAAAKLPGQGAVVMAAYDPTHLPVLSALAGLGAVFNYWYAPLPGPTWPNRFFVHAATSGGLTQSPDDLQMTGGFAFAAGTIYERLTAANQRWRIYHDGLPQAAGITSLRWSYLDPFTTTFRDMEHFENDLRAQDLASYTFIEPRYDTGANFVGGNSMHPCNDVAAGEALIKRVYEALFDPQVSPSGADTMLIITCDEHGGFYDHVPPPAAVAPGDGGTHANPHGFAFDRYGVRVPALVISAYTASGTVIGTDPADPSTRFDHTSILATLAARFALSPLTKRDAAAVDLSCCLTLDAPRSDLPPRLPDPITPAVA